MISQNFIILLNYNVMIHSQERDLYFLKALSMKNKVEELWKRKSTN